MSGRKKAALAIRQLMRSPDVIGHIEILDQSTLQGLADLVNADAVAANEADPGYQAVLIPTPIAGATQNVGFLVKTSRVRIDAVTQERAAETFIDPTTGQAGDCCTIVRRSFFGRRLSPTVQTHTRRSSS